MLTHIRLKVVILPKEDGHGFLAVCPSLQGCHAEGASPGEALDNVQDVARVLLSLRREDGLPLPGDDNDLKPDEAVVEGVLAVSAG
ncbi:MAG: type II toxin-antitoxin system HicB family antitoxin [Firmicutes bacterium]|nr:type II toxin-antitoxin system HicB family antitoxin [Bacillota bacterium]